MDLVDLYPSQVFARVDDSIIFELRPFDLRAFVWAESFFSVGDKGGVAEMEKVIGNVNAVTDESFPLYASTIADICFYLAKDLDDSGIFTSCEFKSKINLVKKEDGGPERAIASLHTSLNQVLNNSFPEPKEAEEAIEDPENGEIYKSMTANCENAEPAKTDWSKIYTTFYREGGISIDDFYSLTFRQIDRMYAEILAQKTSDFKNRVDLTNAIIARSPIKLNGVNHGKPKENFTNDDVSKLQEYQEKMMQELTGHAN